MNAVALRLHEMGLVLEGTGLDEIVAALGIAEREIVRLEELINTPHTTDFVQAVKFEAAHQRVRWAAEHDAGKTDADWFWLIGYLAGKAVHAGNVVQSAHLFSDPATAVELNSSKQLHHIITAAAALLNWHAARTGADTRMRPGIAPPNSPGEAT